MKPLTDNEIRASFVNASRREAKQATLPADLDLGARWESLDYLGWVDRSNPQRAYAVVPVDDEPVGFLLRTAERTRKASAMCAWCEDVFATSEVALFVARRAGASGREGNSLGTLVHADFGLLDARPAPAERHGGRPRPARPRRATRRGACGLGRRPSPAGCATAPDGRPGLTRWGSTSALGRVRPGRRAAGTCGHHWVEYPARPFGRRTPSLATVGDASQA